MKSTVCGSLLSAVLPEIDFHRLAVLAVGKGRRVVCMVLCACFIEVVSYQRLTFRRLAVLAEARVDV